ncbi:MAG: hypothetical protein ACI4DV_07265 [Lachnospiraceae bacterium]
MPGKKRKKRRAYLDDFHKNEKGEYVYRGVLYFRQEKEKNRFGDWLLWGLCIGMLTAVTVAGCVDAPGTMNCAYVLIPYTVNFLSGISVCWGMYRLVTGGDPLRAYIYEATVKQIPGRAVCTAVGAAASAVGEIVFLCRNGSGGRTGGAIRFLLLECVVFVSAVGICRVIKSMKWEKEPEKS